MKKCKSRISITGIGYHECELKAGHTSDHKVTNIEREYTLTWKINDKKDIVKSIKWFKNVSNIEEILKQLKDKYKQYIISVKLHDKHLNSSLNGCKYTITLELKRSKKYELLSMSDQIELDTNVDTLIYSNLNIDLDEYNAQLIII